MKVAIKLDRVYWSDGYGTAELRIVDPELLGDDIELKLRINEMSVIDVRKEWKEVGEA